MLKCECCNITSFTSKQAYQRHLLCKKHKSRECGESNGMVQCNGCKKWYNSRSGLSHQKKNCSKVKNVKKMESDINHLKQTIEEQRLQYEDLKAQIAVLLEQKAGTNNTNSTNNTNNTNIETQNNIIENQNIIVVNSFGEESHDYITDEIIIRWLQNKGASSCIPQIIETVHFHPDHPENHNVMVTSKNNNYCKVKRDNQWVTANKKQTIDKLVNKGFTILETQYEENKESIPNKGRERFETFQTKYMEDDKHLIKELKDNVDLTLINGSDKIYKKREE